MTPYYFHKRMLHCHLFGVVFIKSGSTLREHYIALISAKYTHFPRQRPFNVHKRRPNKERVLLFLARPVLTRFTGIYLKANKTKRHPVHTLAFEREMLSKYRTELVDSYNSKLGYTGMLEFSK